jgi:arabinogalactan oligomer / maltooligosaccharide transport system substrate-binding protein
MKRKILFIAAVLLSLIFFGAACSTANPTPAPSGTETLSAPSATLEASTAGTLTPTPAQALIRGTITLWHSWGETQAPALVQTIADFQALYPDVQFDVLYVPVEDLQARFQTATSEGGGPTILLGPAEWGPSLYDQGAIADLTGLASPDLLDSLNQAALGSGEYNGALISLPQAIRGVVLFRNQRIIAEPPASFSNFITLAQTATQGDFIGAVLERSFFYSGANLNGIGGELMDANGAPAFNDEKGLEWVDLLRAYDQVGPTEFLNDNDLDRFKTGKVGFVIDGTWNMRSLADAIGPQFLTIDPWPSFQNGYLSGYVQSENLFLSSKSEGDDKTAAWKFIEYFLSPTAQAKLAEFGHIPAITALNVTDPLMTQAMTALAGGTTYPTSPNMSAYTTSLNSALKSIFEDGVSPQDALKTAADTIQQSLQDSSATPSPAP